MQIKLGCSDCHQTGTYITHDPYTSPVEIPCPKCNGLGYTFTQEIYCPEFDAVQEKLSEIKTKQNQMHADINYIKAKVG